MFGYRGSAQLIGHDIRLIISPSIFFPTLINAVTVIEDNTLALKEGPTRHSADILRGEGGSGRTSYIGGATFSHRQNLQLR
ncbi:hypothetical protein PUN28_000057 [Cardiocondyla obscurior]|uniref:Uncharacterized protein n=1 Tax=Cardiocondyla obscurior TaxID=286306 RepID=A0AAW2GXN8_9HYME